MAFRPLLPAAHFRADGHDHKSKSKSKSKSKKRRHDR